MICKPYPHLGELVYEKTLPNGLLVRVVQKKGFATRVIRDIQNDIFKLNYNKIEISIDETNSASLKLFENAGFTRTSKDDELINLVYQKIN